MKTNPWLLVLILIESETAPAKQKTMQCRASLIADYDGTQTSFLHNHNSRKTSQKPQLKHTKLQHYTNQIAAKY